jgi:anti-sigma regulatory factor (Ser/Thr protein kinase)
MQATRVSLEPHSSQVRIARQHVAAACSGMERDLVEIAQLLVSELVSNAVQHGQGSVELALSSLPQRLRVEVSDEGPRQPSIRQSSPELLQRGRGLVILERLAAEWGVIAGATGRGKTVWFTLRCR